MDDDDRFSCITVSTNGDDDSADEFQVGVDGNATTTAGYVKGVVRELTRRRDQTARKIRVAQQQLVRNRREQERLRKEEREAVERISKLEKDQILNEKCIKRLRLK